MHSRSVVRFFLCVFVLSTVFVPWTPARQAQAAATAGLGSGIAAPVWLLTGAAPSYADTIAAADALIRQSLHDPETGEGAVGLAVALVDGGRVVWTAGYGSTDKENAVAATADSLFEIGSVSKTMTSMAVMRQVEHGKLNLDAPLASVLPGFSIGPSLRSGGDPMANITIRSMLTHHSGIPGDLLNAAFAHVAIPDYNHRLLAWLKDDHADSPVGLALAYSNTATSLLSSVVEAVAGASFEQETRAMFDLMGMPRTSFHLGPDDEGPGYMGGVPVRSFDVNIAAAGSVISSANEMAAYMQTMLASGRGANGTALTPASVAEMLRPQNVGNPLDPFPIGLIWILSDPDLDYAGRVAWHNGSTILYKSHLALLPDQGLGVFVVSNTAEAGGVVRDVAISVLQNALREKTGLTPPAPPVPAFSSEVTLPPAELEALAGVYVTADGYIKVVVDGAGLRLTANPWLPEATSEPVVPRANGMFSDAASQNVQYEFTTASGRNVLFVQTPQMHLLLGERYEPTPIPAAWLARLGAWIAVDQDPEDFGLWLPPGSEYTPAFELLVDDSMLVLDDGSRSVLAPVSDDAAATWGIGRNKGMTVRHVLNGEGSSQLRYQMFHFEPTSALPAPSARRVRPDSL